MTCVLIGRGIFRSKDDVTGNPEYRELLIKQDEKVEWYAVWYAVGYAVWYVVRGTGCGTRYNEYDVLPEGIQQENEV